ncbi:hypothetical protein H6G41_02565 [Tolypothrix sp. FACHB-123]|uniref:hypothetical protein n=1 Tax=Tolypothrix sp. FACHB-123 TaxID=2692868 RepID=UPI0016870579|nr:hypothetical protein [Tolypothrix sp. FACHB-123]MBD2353514.1 hypothetical protein [Tolypothrix sp. FACHB-123]
MLSVKAFTHSNSPQWLVMIAIRSQARQLFCYSVFVLQSRCLPNLSSPPARTVKTLYTYSTQGWLKNPSVAAY